MHRREALYKPSRTGGFLGLLEKSNLPYYHVLIDGLTHIVDGQCGHAHSGQGLHLGARTVARAGCGRDRHAIASDLELNVNGGQVQSVTERNELGRLLGRHNTGDPGRVQRVALGQSLAPQQLYCFWGHTYESPGGGGAPHHGLVAYVDHPGRALTVEVREVHLPPFGRQLVSTSACQVSWSELTPVSMCSSEILSSARASHHTTPS